MLGCWEFLPPPSTNIDAATAAAAAANTSTITTSPGGTPVTAICLKSIGTTTRGRKLKHPKRVRAFQPAQPPCRGTKGCKRTHPKRAWAFQPAQPPC
jgi:hypothetical protein